MLHLHYGRIILYCTAYIYCIVSNYRTKADNLTGTKYWEFQFNKRLTNRLKRICIKQVRLPFLIIL